MKSTEFIFKILLYLSFLFIVFFLIKFDYLHLEKLRFNYFWLGLSIIMLWLGFVLSTFAWKYSLKLHSINISAKLAIVSHGLSVFAKYIPGKIWVILGRATYVSRYNYRVSELSIISLKEQLLYIFLGLVISFIPTVIYFSQDYWVLFLLLTIVSLGSVLFFKPVIDLMGAILSKIFKRKFELPHLTFRLSVKLSGAIFIYWTVWIFAFFFLLLSLSDEVNFLPAIAFPLSVCYGVLAIVMPGGIGVREGVMVAFLIAVGINSELAITVSIVSRLWFMSGEVFLFILAVYMKRIIK